MANWTLPSVSNILSDIVAFLKNRDVDLAKGMDPANTSVTNPEANFIRWNSANKYWEKFNGTTWNALESDYAINIQFSRILSKPTTLVGYGITDAQPLDADLTALAALASTAGMLSRTGANAFAVRTLTGTANRITISNGTGSGGNPTFDIGTDVVTLTGAQNLTNKTTTTQTAGDNSTKLATTAYADNAASAAASSIPWSTGDVKVTLKTIADSGWVMFNDGSIGDASSGATTRANADTSALFTLVWNNVPETWAGVQDSTGAPVARGASAAADFAAHRRLLLPKTLGRALAVAGAGSGLTSRALGEILGAETHQLTAAESGVPAHTHPASSSGTTTIMVQTTSSAGSNVIIQQSTISLDKTGGTPDDSAALPLSISTSVSANTAANAAQAHNIMQPSSFFNIMVKL